MEFRTKDSNKYWLPVANAPYRWLHIATIQNNYNREFLLFMDVVTNKVYIEEVVGGGLTFIEDDELVKSINFYAEVMGLKTIDRSKPLVEQPFIPTPESKKRLFI